MVRVEMTSMGGAGGRAGTLAGGSPAPASRPRRLPAQPSEPATQLTEPCGPCPDPVTQRAERLIQVRCEVCALTFPAVAPVDDSEIGVENRRDALLVHLVESPECDRRTGRLTPTVAAVLRNPTLAHRL